MKLLTRRQMKKMILKEVKRDNIPLELYRAVFHSDIYMQSLDGPRIKRKYLPYKLIGYTGYEFKHNHRVLIIKGVLEDAKS